MYVSCHGRKYGTADTTNSHAHKLYMSWPLPQPIRTHMLSKKKIIKN